MIRSHAALAHFVFVCACALLPTCVPFREAEEIDSVAPSQPPSGTWAGRVEGTNAFAAVVSDGDQMTGYVCANGDIGEWFFGSASSSAVLTSANGAVLDVSLGPGSATGSVTLADKSVHAFNAAATDAT